MRIQAINLNKSYKINVRLVRRIVSFVFKSLPRRDVTLEIIFLTDKQIKGLNKRYKGKARPTDVLSFDLSEGSPGAGKLLGAIFISIDRARGNSKIFGKAVGEELTLYIIHGILHLAGYDDGRGRDRVKMEKAQDKILRDLCRKENLSKVLTPQ